MISFVIATRDEDPVVLRRTVDDLARTTPRREREIIVVDDGSSTPVSGLGHDVVLIRHDISEGSSRARHHACSVATGDVLVSLDGHMSFDSGWLEPMLREVGSGDLLCAAFWDYDRQEPCAWGADLEWSAIRLWESGRHPGLLAVHRRFDPGPGAHEVPAVLGACYMMLRSTYDAIGGWCPLFRVWGAEEPDLSVRAWKAGFAVRCVADAQVGHLNRSSFRYPVTFDHVELNQLVMIRSLFEHRTIDVLETDFAPISPVVSGWLGDADLAPWRAEVQSRMRIGDSEFLTRFLPELGARVSRH